MKHSFGAIVKSYRERKGLTQLQLAVKTKGKVAMATISKAESAPNYQPKLQTLIELYKVMDVPFDDIAATLEGTSDGK
ncbi:helix-turn-helix transcriptional regulator [Leuconostoc gelidum subsp. gelidum]|uniref:helix-turn-helix transcriptional regulator n=1 Tax=Leuconostoc gelidum TaxID=1244 RepID=UPI001CC48F2F|nr:helix-turn-helix transcriptional regulator [Leuconostoc gelidum]MBZ6013849.1 helix-turn-helix transcriptional regulator [Leuconostoc gelidum subsp. gelidum]